MFNVHVGATSEENVKNQVALSTAEPSPRMRRAGSATGALALPVSQLSQPVVAR
jgi:hypothetical protein